MTVLQSVCSHGHKLQFGDVQQALNIGDPIKREQPLFVRMPPDGVPGESREVWVQLLKTVNGLADGTREWRNCFLATARGLVFETSVLEPCVLVLRGLTTKIPWYHWSGRRRHCWWRRRGLGTGNLQAEGTFYVRALGSGKWKILQSRGRASSRWIRARWTACRDQESGLCAPRKNEEGTIGSCKRD